MAGQEPSIESLLSAFKNAARRHFGSDVVKQQNTDSDNTIRFHATKPEAEPKKQTGGRHQPQPKPFAVDFNFSARLGIRMVLFSGPDNFSEDDHSKIVEQLKQEGVEAQPILGTQAVNMSNISPAEMRKIAAAWHAGIGHHFEGK